MGAKLDQLLYFLFCFFFFLTNHSVWVDYVISLHQVNWSCWTKRNVRIFLRKSFSVAALAMKGSKLLQDWSILFNDKELFGFTKLAGSFIISLSKDFQILRIQCLQCLLLCFISADCHGEIIPLII